MSVLAPPKARKSRKPVEPGIPGFWQCPACVYRIAHDYPDGTEAAILSHRQAHRYPHIPPLSPKTKEWMEKEGDPERILAGWSPEVKRAVLGS